MIAIVIALVAMSCVWTATLSCDVFSSDGATKKSIQRSLAKIGLLAGATVASAWARNFEATTMFFAAVSIHLVDMKIANSRWMTGRMARITIPGFILFSVSSSSFFGNQPLFFAVIAAYAAVSHIHQMRRRQREFYQNFQLLRDKLGTLDAEHKMPAVPIPTRDNHAKAG